MNGTVKFFLNKKGWGFLQGEDGQEAMVHYSDIADQADKFKKLQKGQTVEYTVESTDKGLKARNVTIKAQ